MRRGASRKVAAPSLVSTLARSSSRSAARTRTRPSSSRLSVVPSYKFPGRQKIIISKKWGFINLSRAEYLEKRSIAQPDGAYVQARLLSPSLRRDAPIFVTPHGPLVDNLKRLVKIGV
ncbi:hypothetical protein RHOSPDRAFT_32159 [Rhodotorula sp. JG-1b]|nr:hypothetical protein RHOSPDRAFT_32159 [Rhodotorula sp. JG-1b]